MVSADSGLAKLKPALGKTWTTISNTRVELATDSSLFLSSMSNTNIAHGKYVVLTKSTKEVNVFV